jgi:hypothetical protein
MLRPLGNAFPSSVISPEMLVEFIRDDGEISEILNKLRSEENPEKVFC